MSWAEGRNSTVEDEEAPLEYPHYSIFHPISHAVVSDEEEEDYGMSSNYLTEAMSLGEEEDSEYCFVDAHQDEASIMSHRSYEDRPHVIRHHGENEAKPAPMHSSPRSTLVPEIQNCNWFIDALPCVTDHTKLGHRIEFIQLASLNEGKHHHLQKTFAYHFFGERLVMFKLTDLTQYQQSRNLPTSYTEPNGNRYEILCCKYNRSTEATIPRKWLTLFYVLVDGPQIPCISLQESLNSIANFASVPKPKLPSRLELLVSTAAIGAAPKGKLSLYTDLESKDLEWIPENSNVGCGFIPRAYLERFLGAFRRGKRAFCIQVRIFSKDFGVLKGMLLEKPGIDKIQVPPSMQKVLPSRHGKDTQASLLINAVYPSDVHLQVAKVLNPDPEVMPRESFRPKMLSWMVTSLLESVGVSKPTLQQYVKDSRHSRGLEHSSVVGVADPTNALPPGSIFVTGIVNSVAASLPEVMVTRFPCTDPKDALKLPLITSQPDIMTESDWQFLCTLPFGAIIFANALSGEASLPSICANGDLDGDHYFVLWNKELVNQVTPVPPAKGVYDDGILAPGAPNDDWFVETQEKITNISWLVGVHELIGCLCTLQKKLAETCGAECPDACAFGQAYKDSLEIVKYNSKARLPRHLWESMKPSLHDHLEDIPAEIQCPHCEDTLRHGVQKKPAASSRPPSSNSTSSEVDHEWLQSLKEGDPIRIVGGKYVGCTATFLQLTPKTVRLMVSNKIGGEPISTWIALRNAEPLSSSWEATNSDAERKKPPPTIFKSRDCKVAAPPVPPNTSNQEWLHSLKEGDAMCVVGGKYRGKQATFLRLTPQKVRLRILGVNNNGTDSTISTLIDQRNVAPP